MVNKWIGIGWKICPVCKNRFFKLSKYSRKQWESRKFCSNRCSSLRRKDDDGEIVRLYIDQRYSSTEISKMVGVSGTQVLRILRLNGVEIRPAPENKRLALNKPEVKKKMRDSKVGTHLSEAAKAKLRQLVGSKNSLWRGGITLSIGGYLQFTNSPANGEHAGKMLHKIIAEWKYNRGVESGEHVHHLDGNKLNNNAENLIILSASKHAKLHTEDRENGKRRFKQM